MSRFLKFKLTLLDNVIWLLLGLFFSVCMVTVPAFASWTNLVNILYHSSIMCLLVLAQGFVLMSGHLDLSIDATLAFAPGLVILAATQWFPELLGNPYLCIVLTLVVGALIGLFNGICVSRLGMNAFMQTLSVEIVLRGVILFLIPLSIFPLDPVYSFIGKARVGWMGNLPVAIPVTLGIFLLFHVILRHTVFGRNYMATGGNERASYVAGIDTKKMVIAGFVIAGILAALAGILTAGRQNSVSNTMGNGMVLLAFAGALLGGTSMNGGKGSAFGMLGGAILLGMFSNALNLLGVQVTLVHAAQGTLIFLAILLDRLRFQMRRKLLRGEQLRQLGQSEAAS
jgi:simple sugar transport system permease protein/ribose transport system permease protein